MSIWEASCVHAAIRFIPPAELGFDERALADPEQATMVCARIGLAELARGDRLPGPPCPPPRRRKRPEMRSRFWLGGPYAKVQAGPIVGPLATRAARLLRKPTESNARELLVHCSQEMSHLGTFLPPFTPNLPTKRSGDGFVFLYRETQIRPPCSPSVPLNPEPPPEPRAPPEPR